MSGDLHAPLQTLRPFLKWPGGKTRILNILSEYIKPNKILVEPFVGAGSVFLNIPFEYSILNDINPDLINLFKIVQNNANQFCQTAQKFFIPKYNSAHYYYQFRTYFNQTTDIFERAVLFLYLNKHGFNGLCRYNTKGSYNVPFGAYKHIRFPEREILLFAERSQKSQFSQLCFDTFFKWIKENYTFNELTIYCDPPYAPLSVTSNFTGYAAQKFTLDNQRHLAQWALEFSQQGSTIIISNHDTEFTRQLYNQADIIPLKVQRGISCKASSRIKVNELLAIYSR